MHKDMIERAVKAERARCLAILERELAVAASCGDKVWEAACADIREQIENGEQP